MCWTFIILIIFKYCNVISLQIHLVALEKPFGSTFLQNTISLGVQGHNTEALASGTLLFLLADLAGVAQALSLFLHFLCSLLLCKLLTSGDGVLFGSTFGLGGRFQPSALQDLQKSKGQNAWRKKRHRQDIYPAGKPKFLCFFPPKTLNQQDNPNTTTSSGFQHQVGRGSQRKHLAAALVLHLASVTSASWAKESYHLPFPPAGLLCLSIGGAQGEIQ